MQKLQIPLPFCFVFFYLNWILENKKKLQNNKNSENCNKSQHSLISFQSTTKPTIPYKDGQNHRTHSYQSNLKHTVVVRSLYSLTMGRCHANFRVLMIFLGWNDCITYIFNSINSDSHRFRQVTIYTYIHTNIWFQFH